MDAQQLRTRVAKVLRTIFGEVHWSPPEWVRACGRGARNLGSLARRNPPLTVGLLALLLSVGLLVGWGVRSYLRRPKPVTMAVSVHAPELTKIEQHPRPHPLVIEFEGSAAPLANVGKEVKQGIELSPPLPGTWRWQSDSQLVFTLARKTDWPVGEEMKTILAKKGLLADTVRLEDYRLEFSTPAFAVTFGQAEFHQDPVDPELKKVVATVSFTHPVDPASLEKNVKLTLLDDTPKSYGFKVSYDKFRGEAYIHSDKIAIPGRDLQMRIVLEPGIRAERGGPPTSKPLSRQVRVPGIYNAMKVSSLQLAVASDEHNEPVQALLLSTALGVNEKDVASHLHAWVLPLHHPDQYKQKQQPLRPYVWSNPELVGPEILARSQRLRLTQVPNETSNSTLHSFRFQAEVGRYLYVRLDKGLRSFGGYILGEPYDAISRVPEFPKVLKIAQTGAILSLSGEKKLSIYARDIEGLHVEIGRVLPEQLGHLAPQMRNNFASPNFYYGLSEDAITELFTENRALPKLPPGKGQYHALDLSKYLQTAGGGRRLGLFLLKVQPYTPATKSIGYENDRRLVLVTNLGLIVKDQADGSHEIFVQSIGTGDPVAGAKVEVVGRNGLPVLSVTTDAAGRARLPSLEPYKRTQEPTLYLVRQGTDVAFLPLSASERYLNNSRFDVGGVSDRSRPEGLNAYLFSDRGIYRPGDEIRVGMIVKARDWRRPLAGLPLEITVTDPRGLMVRREKLRLSGAGFEELKHTTSETALTGNYVVGLQLVQDNQQRALLGSTTVQVREFLPDRMKIQAHLSKRNPSGWVHPKDLSASVSLQNLFGIPAVDRLVRAELELTPHFPSFWQHRSFVFHNWMPAIQGHHERLEEKQTDDKGEAKFDLNLERFRAGTYLLRFTANGYEAEGGRSVVGEASAVVSPLPYLIGYKPDGELGYLSRGSRHAVELIAIGPDGAKRAVSGLRLVLTERRYVSVLTRQSNGTFRFESVRREVNLSERALSIPAEGTSLPLPTGRAGDFAFVVRDRKNTELSRMNFSIAGEANLARSLDKSSELHLTLKKRDVDPGEELEVQIRAPFAGAGLITVERDKVYAHKWFKTTTNATVQRIKVPAELEGNGYLSVSFHRDINSDQIYTSPLAYGVVPFSISRKRRAVAIKLEHADVVKPGQPLAIKYRTDRKAKLVVFAVDEGILQVGGYKTPDPLGHFLQKRALEVRTAQILDLVLPEFRHLMSAPGGDGDGVPDKEDAISRNLNPFKRRREKPVAYWSGILDSAETPRQVTYQVPESFNGTLRVMAVAVTAEAVGASEEKALVRGDFVISANLPTFVAPGDEFTVSAAVANNVAGSGRLPVKVSLGTSKHLEVAGSSSTTLTIAEQREATATFQLRARPVLGSGSLTFQAAAGGKSAKLTIDLSVRPASPYLTTLSLGNVRGGEAKVAVQRQLYPEYRLLKASFSPLPLGMAPALMSYLEKFPHGCTEQLVSQAMPALVLRKRPEFGIAAATAEKSLLSIISTLRSRQNSEGGFGLWTAHPRTAVFSSIYALHFLLDARERNLEIPEDLLRNGLGWLRGFVATDGDDLPALRLRAYGIYVLTRSGMVTGGPSATLHKRLEKRFAGKWRKDLAGIYLAATYRLLRQDRLANELISVAMFGEERGQDYANYYDGLIRDAQLLYVIARHFPQHASRVSSGGVKALLAPIARGQYNTLSSAYVIQALEAYAGTAVREGGSRTVTELLPGGARRAIALPAGLIPQVSFSENARELLFGSRGDFESLYSVTQAGFDRNPSSSTLKQKLEVYREYRSGDKVVSSVKRGEDLTVHVRLRSLSSSALHNLAIVDLLPGGFEVVIEPPSRSSRAGSSAGDDEDSDGDNNDNGDRDRDSDDNANDDVATSGTGPSGIAFALPGSTFAPEYADVREDRVVLYGTATTKMQEFVYKIRATTAGRFAAPPLKGESLYDRTVVAQSPGGRITVSK